MTETSNGNDTTVTDTEAKIIKQMEYYFGDINLMRDKFLKEKIQEDEGWVTLETMLKFNRLKQLSEDPSAIAAALMKSESGLMEVNEAKDKVRRTPSKPLPDDSKERRDEITQRSIYAKRFPLDAKLDDLMAFFETFGAVENVVMKKDFKLKTFKGSVFATFCNKADAEKFVKEEGTKYQDLELEKKCFKADYFKSKYADQKKKGGSGEGDKNEGDDARKEVKKGFSEMPRETDEEKAKRQMTKNAILHFKGLNPDTELDVIKEYFGDYGEVGWVDLEKGKGEGYLRMRNPDTAAPTLEKAKAANDGKIVVNDSELEMRVVEGDEELEYWKKMFRSIADRNNRNKRHRGGGRGGGRGGFQRRGQRNRSGPQGKRRSHGGEDDEPVSKAAKVDAE